MTTANMTDASMFELPAEYADWIPLDELPDHSSAPHAIEVRVTKLNRTCGELNRKLTHIYFVPPKPKPTVPDVGIGAVVRFTSKSSGDTYRVMKGDEGWWFDQRDSDWSDSDLLATVNDDGFTVELDGL